MSLALIALGFLAFLALVAIGVGIAWLIREVLDIQARMQWVVTAVIQIAPSYVAPPPSDRRVQKAEPGSLYAPKGFGEDPWA